LRLWDLGFGILDLFGRLEQFSNENGSALENLSAFPKLGLGFITYPLSSTFYPLSSNTQ